MNAEELKLTEYLHNIIEDNMSLRNENDRLWKQKLEYIGRIEKAIECIKEFLCTEEYISLDGEAIANNYGEILKILKGEENE